MTDKKIVDGKPPKVGDGNDSLDDVVSDSSSSNMVSPGQLMADAQQCVKEYFLKNYSSVLGGNLTLSIAKMFANYALNCIDVVPVPPKGQAAKYLKYEINDKLNVDSSRELMVEFAGDSVKEMDIYNDESVLTNLEEMANIISDKDEVSAFFNGSYFMYHNYLAVLSIEPELRPLVAVAVGKKDLIFVSESGFTKKKFEEMCVPTFAEIVEVAKEYGVKEIGPVLKALQDVKEQYNGMYEPEPPKT